MILVLSTGDRRLIIVGPGQQDSVHALLRRLTHSVHTSRTRLRCRDTCRLGRMRYTIDCGQLASYGKVTGVCDMRGFIQD